MTTLFFSFSFLCFQIFHLWAIVLSHQIPSLYISFTFFFYICSPPFFHPVIATSVLLSFSFFFFLPFFTSITSFFLFFFHLFTLMLLWVLLYFFMCLFVFKSVGFVWLMQRRERQRPDLCSWVVCLCDGWVVWVGFLRVGIGGFRLSVVVGGEVAPTLSPALAKCNNFG